MLHQLTEIYVMIVLYPFYFRYESLSMLLVHGEFLRRQVWFYGLAAGVALALKLAVAGTHGITGVVWAGNLAFGFIYTPFAWSLAREAMTDVAQSASAPPSAISP
mgnify:CR=1 FL=1